MFGFFAVRTAKLISDEDPVFSSAQQFQGYEIDLWKMGFMFAVTQIAPEIGTIEAYQATWFQDGEKQKEKKQIKLVSCDELQAGGSHEN